MKSLNKINRLLTDCFVEYVKKIELNLYSKFGNTLGTKGHPARQVPWDCVEVPLDQIPANTHNIGFLLLYYTFLNKQGIFLLVRKTGLSVNKDLCLPKYVNFRKSIARGDSISIRLSISNYVDT